MGYNKPHIATQTTRFLCHCWFVFGSRTCGVHDFCRAHLGSIASYGFWLRSCVETAGGSSSDFEPLSIPMGWCGLGWQNMGGVMLLPSHLWGLEATFWRILLLTNQYHEKWQYIFFFNAQISVLEIKGSQYHGLFGKRGSDPRPTEDSRISSFPVTRVLLCFCWS